MEGEKAAMPMHAIGVDAEAVKSGRLRAFMVRKL